MEKRKVAAIATSGLLLLVRQRTEVPGVESANGIRSKSSAQMYHDGTFQSLSDLSIDRHDS